MDEETLNKMSPAEKQQVMAQVQQQVALAQMQELLTVRFTCSDPLLLDRRSIDLRGAREKEGHFHYKNFLGA